MLGDEAARRQLTDALAACRCSILLPAEWTGFFDEAGPAAGAFDERRQYPRLNCRGCAALRYRQTMPALPRPSAWYKVYTKDISRCGVGLLHGEQLYPRERMAILLPDGSCRAIEVVRCRRIGPRCFEIGARFVAGQQESESEALESTGAAPVASGAIPG